MKPLPNVSDWNQHLSDPICQHCHRFKLEGKGMRLCPSCDAPSLRQIVANELRSA